MLDTTPDTSTRSASMGGCDCTWAGDDACRQRPNDGSICYLACCVSVIPCSSLSSVHAAIHATHGTVCFARVVHQHTHARAQAPDKLGIMCSTSWCGDFCTPSHCEEHRCPFDCPGCARRAAPFAYEAHPPDTCSRLRA